MEKVLTRFTGALEEPQVMMSAEDAAMYLLFSALANVAWASAFYFRAEGLNKTLNTDTNLSIIKTTVFMASSLGWGLFAVMALMAVLTGNYSGFYAATLLVVAMGGLPVMTFLGAVWLWQTENRDQDFYTWWMSYMAIQAVTNTFAYQKYDQVSAFARGV